jgi:hypothetical protein
MLVRAAARIARVINHGILNTPVVGNHLFTAPAPNLEGTSDGEGS